jgi:hypothetical protein
MQFSELIGQEVGLLLPKISTARIFRVKVLGVESGGIWISSQAAVSAILQVFHVQVAPQTLAFFIPFHEITFATAESHVATSAEKASGG